MIVEVTTHGSVIKRDHDSFLIKSDDSSSEIPAEKIDAIIISSNSLISTQAIRLCIEKEIQLVVSDWTGRPMARLWSSTPGKATQIREPACCCSRPAWLWIRSIRRSRGENQR